MRSNFANVPAFENTTAEIFSVPSKSKNPVSTVLSCTHGHPQFHRSNCERAIDEFPLNAVSVEIEPERLLSVCHRPYISIAAKFMKVGDCEGERFAGPRTSLPIALAASTLLIELGRQRTAELHWHIVLQKGLYLGWRFRVGVVREYARLGRGARSCLHSKLAARRRNMEVRRLGLCDVVTQLPENGPQMMIRMSAPH